MVWEDVCSKSFPRSLAAPQGSMGFPSISGWSTEAQSPDSAHGKQVKETMR